MKLPRYISPIGEEHISYFSHIKDFNLQLQQNIATGLADELDGPHALVAMLTTGSDGRLEKGPKSLVEVVAICRSEEDVPDEMQKLREVVNRRYVNPIFMDPVEVKQLESQMMSFYGGDPDKVYPCRVVDAKMLYGRESIFLAAKRKLIQEIQGGLGRTVISRIKNRRRETKRITRTGVGRWKGDVIHYDLDLGVAHYNEDTYQLAFKAGPLRFVQWNVLYVVLKQVQTMDAASVEAFLLDIPRTIPDRLDFLVHEGKMKLSESELKQVSDSYLYFLWSYHVAQFEALKHGSKTSEFDRAEVTGRITALADILSGPILAEP